MSILPKIISQFSEYKPIRILFIFGLFIKLVLITAYDPVIFNSLFKVFVESYLFDNHSNNYTVFLEDNLGHFFPYPAGMLYILSPFYHAASYFHDIVFLERFLLKLPILISDLIIFIVISNLLNSGKSLLRFTILYWISPVTIYINFIHGQLDVIPISILLLCVHYLFNKQYYLSASLFGFAVSTKTVVFAVAPFILIFLFIEYKQLKKIFSFLFFSALTFVLINSEFVNSNGFYEMVFNNNEQLRLFQTFFAVGEMNVYLIPVVYGALLMLSISVFSFTRNLLIILIGSSFLSILSFVQSEPGWFYWIIPFLAYFLSLNSINLIPYFGLQLIYLTYFGELQYLEQYFGISLDKNLIFTLMQVFLIINTFLIFRYGFFNFYSAKLFSKPFLIGIGGNSGTGKTTLAKSIEKVFSKQRSITIHGDASHKWERGNQNWNKLTHLNPIANNLYDDFHALKFLKKGSPIYRRNYNHSSGEFDDPEKISSRNLVIYDGLHAFFLPHQRKLFDLKIFLEPEMDASLHWKVQRDVHGRGYSREKVLDQINKRSIDKSKFIDSQKNDVDIAIHAFFVSQNDPSEIGYKMTIVNTIPLDNLLLELRNDNNLKISHEYIDPQFQELTFSGSPDKVILKEKILDKIYGVNELLISKIEWEDTSYDLLTVIIIYIIFLTSSEAIINES